MKFKSTHTQGILEKLWFIYGQRLHKEMVNSSANYYLKPNDIISHRPTLFGYHEPHLEKLIEEVAKENSDFLLDLGANIGMTSAHIGQHFKRIDCVEPNEWVFNILKTNLALNLKPDRYHAHMIGLGHADDTLKLLIPHDNFGGAFIKSENNIFEKKRQEFLKEDEDHQQNLTELDVTIKDAEKWLKTYFAQLKSEKLTKGVIKIDVEGYEEIIFESVLSSMPKGFEAVVIMENWFDHFPVDKFKSKQHDLSWYYFKKNRRLLHSLPFKLLGLSSSYKFTVEALDENTVKPHDVICVMSKKAS